MLFLSWSSISGPINDHSVVLPPSPHSRSSKSEAGKMSYYDLRSWQNPARQASWDQPATPTHPGKKMCDEPAPTQADHLQVLRQPSVMTCLPLDFSSKVGHCDAP